MNIIQQPSRHTFESILGHEVLKRYLLRAVEDEVLPHALLFHGPPGLGKTSTAYALAKRLNCLEGHAGPCECNLCRKISEGVFADLLVIEPRGAAGQITISGWKPGKDDPEGLQYYRFVDSRPLEGKKKVLIIRQAERMNVTVSNYLLKLIEEPPSYLLIVLVTHRMNELLGTIRSRCAPVKFSPLEDDEIRLYAAEAAKAAGGGDVSMLLHLCEGRPGVVLDLLGEARSGQREEIARVMTFFQQHGFIGVFRAASDLQKLAQAANAGGSGAGDGFELGLNLVQAWLRDACLAKCCSPETLKKTLVYAGLEEQVAAYSEKSDLEGLLTAADSLHQAYEYIPRQIDRNYVLEMMLFGVGRAMRK